MAKKAASQLAKRFVIYPNLAAAREFAASQGYSPDGWLNSTKYQGVGQFHIGYHVSKTPPVIDRTVKPRPFQVIGGWLNVYYFTDHHNPRPRLPFLDSQQVIVKVNYDLLQQAGHYVNPNFMPTHQISSLKYLNVWQTVVSGPYASAKKMYQDLAKLN